MVEPVIAPTLFTVVLLVLVGLAVVRYMHRRSRGAERDAVTPPERRGTFHRGTLDARTGGDRSGKDRTRERRRAANE